MLITTKTRTWKTKTPIMNLPCQSRQTTIRSSWPSNYSTASWLCVTRPGSRWEVEPRQASGPWDFASSHATRAYPLVAFLVSLTYFLACDSFWELETKRKWPCITNQYNMAHDQYFQDQFHVIKFYIKFLKVILWEHDP